MARPLPHPTMPPRWLRISGCLAVMTVLCIWGAALFVLAHFIVKHW